MATIVGIIVVHNFMSDINDIITVPFTFTGWDFTFSTIDIFTNDNTVVEFTFVDGFRSIKVTVFNEDI